MFKISNDIDVVFEQPEPPIYTITAWFLCLTMLLSTQDIAVDGSHISSLFHKGHVSLVFLTFTINSSGWALALLSKPIRGWASTCQVCCIAVDWVFFACFLRLTFTLNTKYGNCLPTAFSRR